MSQLDRIRISELEQEMKRVLARVTDLETELTRLQMQRKPGRPKKSNG